MDRFFNIEANQHNYIASVLNSEQQQREEQTEQVITYPFGGRGVAAQRKKIITTMNRKPLPAFVKSTPEKLSMDHSTTNAAGKYSSSRRRIGHASSDSYIPPSPLCSSRASSSTKEAGRHYTNSTTMNDEKSIPTPSRRRIGRARSTGYIPPSPLCTNARRSTKEPSIDHSTVNSGNNFPRPIRQGIGRVCSDSYIHPSRALDDGIDVPTIPGRRSSTGNMAAAPTTGPTVMRRGSKTRMMAFSAITGSIAAATLKELKPSVSSSSVISTGSTVSSTSSSSYATGNNMYNSLTGTGIHVAKSAGMEDNIMMDDCSVAITAATITSENESDYESSLLSSSYQNISYSLRRILSNMSNESLLIMEGTDDEDEQDNLMMRDISSPSSPNDEVGENLLIPKNSDNEVPLVVTDEKKGRKITTTPPQSQYYYNNGDSDDRDKTLASTNSSDSMMNNNSSWRGNRRRYRHFFRSPLHCQKDGSFH